MGNVETKRSTGMVTILCSLNFAIWHSGARNVRYRINGGRQGVRGVPTESRESAVAAQPRVNTVGANRGKATERRDNKSGQCVRWRWARGLGLAQYAVLHCAIVNDDNSDDGDGDSTASKRMHALPTSKRGWRSHRCPIPQHRFPLHNLLEPACGAYPPLAPRVSCISRSSAMSGGKGAATASHVDTRRPGQCLTANFRPPWVVSAGTERATCGDQTVDGATSAVRSDIPPAISRVFPGGGVAAGRCPFHRNNRVTLRIDFPLWVRHKRLLGTTVPASCWLCP